MSARLHATVLLLALPLAAAAQAPPGRFQPDPKLPADLGVPYIIVTSEDQAAAWQRLAEHKRGTGLPAQVVTVEWLQRSPYYPGVDLPERLYRLLQDLRLNWRTRWLLLAGDVETVPQQRIRASHGAHTGNQWSSDVYYSDLLPADASDPDAVAGYGWNGDGDRFVGDVRKDGFDLVPELFVGRIPSDDKADAEAFLDKYFEYVHPAAKDSAWMSRALVVGANEFGQRQGEVAELFRSLGGAGYGADLLVERKPDPVAAITEELNRGCAFMDFFCHGCPTHFWAMDDHTSWGVVQARTLKNAGKYPVVFANSCDTCQYEKDETLAELLVIQPKAGAIAYFGYSALSYGSTVNREIYRVLFAGDCPELARALVTAKSKVAADTWVGQILQLMGEPEMWVRTGAPREVAATAEILAAGVPAVLRLKDAAGRPVKGARVCVEAAGVYITGTSDADGRATLPPPARAGGARVSVHAQNGVKSEGKLTVEAKPPANVVPVARPAPALDDSGDEPAEPDKDDPARLRGNGQKDLNPGETVRVTFAWAKEAPLPEGELRLDFPGNPWVRTVAGPEFAEGRTAATFRVSVARRIPAWTQAWAELRFAAAAGGEPWVWTYRLPVEGPWITVAAVAVDDAEGNRDRRIGWEDAGKKVRFTLGLHNGGTQKAANLKVTATTADPSVTLAKTEIAFGTVPCEEVVHPKDKAFELALAADYDGHPIAFAVVIEDDRRNRWEGRLVFTVPPAPPLLPRAEPGLRSVALSWTPGGSAGVVGYHVYRAATEKGPFQRLTEQPVRRATRFPDATVKPMSAYVYVVTSVTADGLESRFSAPVRAVTLSPLPRLKEGSK